jgi:hypothetical protein
MYIKIKKTLTKPINSDTYFQKILLIMAILIQLNANMCIYIYTYISNVLFILMHGKTSNNRTAATSSLLLICDTIYSLCSMLLFQ